MHHEMPLLVGSLLGGATSGTVLKLDAGDPTCYAGYRRRRAPSVSTNAGMPIRVPSFSHGHTLGRAKHSGVDAVKAGLIV